LALPLVVPLLVAGCGPAAAKRTAAARPSHTPTPSRSPSPVPLTLAITPAAGTADLPVSTEIGTTVAGGKISEVALVDAKGQGVPGDLREDGSSWVPAGPLDFAARYAATVTATGADGRTAKQTTTFTTMRQPGGTRVGSGLYLFTGATYGVAMPVVVEFESDIPAEARASVQRRLFVKSEPPQTGRWHWFGARQVMYRPPAYWQPGTKLTVRVALTGHPIGARFGDTDRSATATIGRKFVMEVDNATKQLSALQDDKVVRTMPVSLGKPSTPSSSGAMVIMSKEESTVFNTPEYRVQVAYAMRLTWGGQYIHAAPWSVQDQGVRNVSHGCVNVSTGNAAWLFAQTLVGDPVTVHGTEAPLDPGDGWTAWDTPWSEFAA
jgi:lipoprotein-anchoring transpeptidase ErfK/SrfK